MRFGVDLHTRCDTETKSVTACKNKNIEMIRVK